MCLSTKKFLTIPEKGLKVPPKNRIKAKPWNFQELFN